MEKTIKKPTVNKIPKRSFHLTKEENEKYLNWKNTLPPKHFGAIGGGYSFIFTPTSMGDIIKVKRDDGYEIDLTDYDSF